MLLKFTAAGDFLRPFINLLQATTKQGVVLFFQPLDNVLVLRTVGPNSTLYLVASVGTEHFHEYCYDKGDATADSFAVDGVLEAGKDSSAEVNNMEHHVPVLSRALLATVLRQPQGLHLISVQYSSRDGDGISKDVMQWECVCGDGIVKVFMLPLVREKLERAYVNPERYVFDACASAKTWGHFLRHLPGSQFIVVQPHDTHLELLVMNCSEAAGHEVDSKVLVRQGDLLFMRRIHRATEGNDDGYSLLPGKYAELKPLKHICLLADQLGMMIRLRSAMGGVPLFVETLTMQEAQSLKAGGAPTVSMDTVIDTTAPDLYNRGMAPISSSLRIRYAVYIPAIDIWPSSADSFDAPTDGGRRSVASTATSHRDSRDLTNIASPRGSVGLPQADPCLGCAETPVASATTAVNGVTSAPLPTGLHFGTNQVGPGGGLNPQTLASPTPAPLTSGYSVGSPAISAQSAPLYDPPPSGVVIDGNMMMVRSTFQIGNSVGSEHTNYKRSRDNVTSERSSALPFSLSERVPCTDNFGPQPIEQRGHESTTWSTLTPEKRSSSQLNHDEQSKLPPMGSRQLPLDARYPLDFNAYVQELDEGRCEDDLDEDDEDLQRFLDSCASVLVVPQTQSY